MSIIATEVNDAFQFLGHRGEAAQIIRDHAWSDTPLGEVESWTAPLRVTTAMLLQSPVPIVMLWGADGVMIYNDAYSVFAGHRHPAIFGSKVREGWAEIADFNDNVMKVVLSGGTLAYRNQEMTLHRNGYPEQVWMDLDYSPVLDEQGKPAGVIAIVVEKTERVLAQRRNREDFRRLKSLFEQAPTFMAMLSGPRHRIDMVNPECRRLIGNRDVEGLYIDEAMPEMVGQNFRTLLDHVLETGEAARRDSQRALLRWSDDGPLEERFIDFVYQPIRDESGAVGQIFVQGSDVTERVRAETYLKLLINELNHRVKNTLASIQSIVTQTLRSVQTKDEAAAAISARIIALSRAHNVLTDENWHGADLRTMIESAVDPFQPADQQAIFISGPELRVGPHAALSLSLAMNELATNSVKFGGLSCPRGRVQIQWSTDAEENFRLSWTEIGGPTVVDNNREGFGSRLILQVLPHELGGKAEISYNPAGIVFTLTTTTKAIMDQPMETGH
jgi:PAS domain S-box-containing protein